MKKTINLIKPLKVNGVDRKELEYDTSLITGEQFLEADARAHSKAAQLAKPSLTVAETDDSLQYYLGIMAIVAVNPDIDVTDIERISGPDIMNLYRIGRNFTKGSAEEEEDMENPDFEEKDSEEHTEDMQELTIQDKES